MKKYISLLLIAIILASFTACNNNKENQETISSDNQMVTTLPTSETITEIVVPATEPTTEVSIPTVESLNENQKALLPFYNNGFSLTSGDRDLYYLGELIATSIPIYANHSTYYWTITNDFIVYFRGKTGYQMEGKWLMTYDVKTGETKELRDWYDLEKYGDVDFFTSDGINVFIVFSCGSSNYDSWYNIVKIDENGNDTLVCKTTYGAYDPSSNIDYGYLGHLMNFGEENIFYTTGHEDDGDNDYIVKIKINFDTGEYEVVDREKEIPGGKGKTNSNGDNYWSNLYQILPDSMFFLRDNTFYYGETRQEIDELNGEISTLTDIIKVNRETREEELIGTLSHDLVSDGGGTYYGYDGNAFLTDKYFVYKSDVMNLETGEVIDYYSFIESNSDDIFFNM